MYNSCSELLYHISDSSSSDPPSPQKWCRLPPCVAIYKSASASLPMDFNLIFPIELLDFLDFCCGDGTRCSADSVNEQIGDLSINLGH